MAGDSLTLEGDKSDGVAIIAPLMEQGRRLTAPVPLKQSRDRALDQLKKLPDGLKRLERAPAYPVRVSEAIRFLARDVDERQLHSGDRKGQKTSL
jgi:nicotinate phosphoribosyltransferase